MTKAVALSPTFAESCRIVHQTGDTHVAAVREAYAELPVEVEVVSFISDLPRQLQLADIVVSRAGAVTLADRI